MIIISLGRGWESLGTLTPTWLAILGARPVPRCYWGGAGGVGAWESAKTPVLFPVDAAPLAKHLVSPTVLLSLGRLEEGSYGRRRRPSRNCKGSLELAPKPPHFSHIWSNHADVSGWRVPPLEAPQSLEHTQSGS